MPETNPQGKKLAPIYVIFIALAVGIICLFIGRYSVNCDKSAGVCPADESASPESFYESETPSARPKVILPSPTPSPSSSVTVTATISAEPSVISSDFSE